MSATSIASLQSVEYYKWSDQTPCTLRLYYHALGANLGSLTVRINSTQSVDLMESITLTNADDWISYDVDLSTVSGRYRVSIKRGPFWNWGWLVGGVDAGTCLPLHNKGAMSLCP